jgi:hypothetical protein
MKSQKLTTLALISLFSLPLARAYSDSCGSCSGAKASDAACVESASSDKKVEYTLFGEQPKLTDADNIDAAKVLADVSAYEGKYVRMTGVIQGVCKSKGCWLKMNSEGTALTVFVHFTCPVDGRLIPMEAMGKPVIVEGELKTKEISEADARHIAEEEGLAAEEIAKIVGPQKLIEVTGPSALVAMQAPPVASAN